MQQPHRSAPPRLRPVTAVGCAVATGSLVALAAPGVLPWSTAALLAWPAFTPLLVALRHRSAPRAALLGWLAGVTFTAIACPWFPGLVARFSGASAVAAVAVAAAFAAYQGLGWALWAALVARQPLRLPVWLLAPAAFVAMERWVPTLFPYSLGLTQYQNLRIASVAALGSPYVITFLLVLAGAALAELGTSRPAGRGGALVALFVTVGAIGLAVAFGTVRLRSVQAERERAPALRIAAIQAGVMHRGWASPTPDRALLARYQQASARVERQHGPVELMVWPEKAYPLLLRADARHDYPPGHHRRIRRGFVSPLAFGVTTVEPQSRQVRNSVAFLDRNDALQVLYDKIELILYSERLPAWAARWADGGQRYEAGRRRDPLVLPLEPPGPSPRRPPATARLAFFICFESSFPGHVAELSRRGAHLLVNLSDDAWFGDGAEPEQHLSQAVFRAIEARRDLVRASGSGVTAFIAATGRIEGRLPLNRTRAEAARALVGPVALLRSPSLYGAVRDGFAVVCLLLCSGAVGLSWARRWRRG